MIFVGQAVSLRTGCHPVHRPQAGWCFLVAAMLRSGAAAFACQ